MIKNIKEDVIVPDTPKIVPDEVRFIYVPKATYDRPGIASYDRRYFEINGTTVTIESYANEVNEKLDGKIQKYQGDASDANDEYYIPATKFSNSERSETHVMATSGTFNETLVLRNCDGAINCKTTGKSDDEAANVGYISTYISTHINGEYSNALRGNASGRTVIIDDVSPLEHKVSVKLSSDTLSDDAEVIIRTYGKNLICYHDFYEFGTSYGDYPESFITNVGDGTIKIEETRVFDFSK